jgi:hypothetical protein
LLGSRKARSRSRRARLLEGGDRSVQRPALGSALALALAVRNRCREIPGRSLRKTTP